MRSNLNTERHTSIQQEWMLFPELLIQQLVTVSIELIEQNIYLHFASIFMFQPIYVSFFFPFHDKLKKTNFQSF